MDFIMSCICLIMFFNTSEPSLKGMALIACAIFSLASSVECFSKKYAKKTHSNMETIN